MTAALPIRMRAGWAGRAFLVAAGLVALGLALALPRWRRPETAVVLVTGFELQSDRAREVWLEDGLTRIVRSDLGRVPGLRVLPQEGAAAGEGLPTRLAAARSAGASQVVQGSLHVEAERFRLILRVARVAAGSQTEFVAEGRHPDDVLPALERLCRQAESLLLRDTDPPAQTSPDPSAEAARHYVRAVTAFARGGQAGSAQALEELDRAIALDSELALAYLRKAEIQHWRQRWGYDRDDPLPTLAAASRRAARFSYPDRLLLDSFVALLARGDLPAALRNWELLLRFHTRFAQRAGVPVMAAEAFERLGRWQDVLVVGEAHVDARDVATDERARLLDLLASAHRQLGEHAQALECARRGVASWPVREGPAYLQQRAWLATYLLNTGERGAALEQLRALADRRDADARALTMVAWGLYATGARSEAQTAVERALRLDPGYGNGLHLRGWLGLAHGDFTGAAESLEAAYASTPPSFGAPHYGQVEGDLAALYYAGVAAAKGGLAERARADLTQVLSVAERLLDSPRVSETPALRFQAENFLARAAARLGRPGRDPGPLEQDPQTYFLQTARLEAVRGRRQLALQALADARLPRNVWQHARDDPDFESLRHDPRFLALVRPP